MSLYHSSKSGPSVKVELAVSCSHLKRMDLLSESDPMVVLFVYENERYKEYGRTEYIKDNENPHFLHKFVLDYKFEESQELKLAVFDVDAPCDDLRKHDFIGETILSLHEVFGSKGHVVTHTLENDKYPNGRIGTITVRAEEVSDPRFYYRFELAASDLDRKDFLGKSDPYVVISRVNEDGDWDIVHKTEWIKQTLNPHWKCFEINSTLLTRNDRHRTLRFEVYDYDSHTKSDLIGEFECSIHQIIDLDEKIFPVIHPKKKTKANKKNKPVKTSGCFKFLVATEAISYSFVQYLAGGAEFNLVVAIDYTASNGEVFEEDSLHYLHPDMPNAYESAIMAVGNIVGYYDSDKLIPALGFGAKLNATNQIEHCFNINFTENPECNGIPGVLEAYRDSMHHVGLYGPTNFAPVIRAASSWASQHPPEEQYYTILLLITDGVVSDMDATVKAIVDASELPLSIIIVGVGNANFAKMEFLDADEKRLSHCGKEQARDTVQFVPFRELKNNPTLLARETLREIPEQVLEFYRKNMICPREKIVAKPTVVAESPISPRATPDDAAMPWNKPQSEPNASQAQTPRTTDSPRAAEIQAIQSMYARKFGLPSMEKLHTPPGSARSHAYSQSQSSSDSHSSSSSQSKSRTNSSSTSRSSSVSGGGGGGDKASAPPRKQTSS